MTDKLIVEELIDEARRDTGLERFDSDSFREGLGILLDGLNAEERPEASQARLRGLIVKNLADRLKIADYIAKRPEVLKLKVERPVFVFGIPRTGTTLLSNLLAADPNRRSLLAWEIEDPVPPPTTATLYNDPRALAQIEEQNRMLAAMPEMGKYYRSSPIYPNECMFVMMHDFKALAWEGRGNLLRYRDWLFHDADLTSTYEYHKRFLQMHQADAPGVWNLKMPSHSLFLETLLKVFPDARLIWSHRDPLTATGSFCSLMTLLPKSSGGPIDYEAIGRNYSWQAIEHAERIMNFRDRHGEDRIVDSHYADLIRDPIGAMRKLYAQLGDEFTAEAQAGMQAWLDDNPQGKFGRHEYKIAQYGLTESGLRKRFDRYLSRYHVEPEG